MSPVAENLFILFLLAPMMIASWWWIIRLINYSMGFKLKKVYESIYSDPKAAAILRVGIMFSVAYLVNGAFGRYV